MKCRIHQYRKSPPEVRGSTKPKGQFKQTAERVFKYAQSTGIVSNIRYPYTMNASRNCRWKFEDVVATDNGYYVIPHGNEMSVQRAVASHGPVAVGISTNGLHYYNSGVLYSSDCGSATHAALVVGYGSDALQGDYWIVRNSWGFWWGEEGYVRMARNKHNMCGIASAAFFPY